MHNIKEIKNNFEEFKKLMKLRNVDINLDNILSLDEKNRKLIQEKETLEMEKKNISKSKDEKLFAKSKDISLKIDELSKKQNLIKIELDNILSTLPNLPLSEVPHGKDDNSNKEVIKVGENKKYNFKPL